MIQRQRDECDIAVIGGGLVGMAIAYGLMRRGRQVTVFDEGDSAFRASRGNFGLVWVQGKGLSLPDYAHWSRLSSELWPAFSQELSERSGQVLELQQSGGLQFFLSDDEAEKEVAELTQLRDALGGDYPFEYLGHNATRELVPEIGPTVVGSTYCPMDGHVNPLYLLRALHTATNINGVKRITGPRVETIQPLDKGFKLQRSDGNWHAQQVVLCAGLGNATLAPTIGLNAPVRPNRGQILITERVQPFLAYPSGRIRQVGEGAVQIGDSNEDVGLNDQTDHEVIAKIAQRAVRYFPLLEHVRIVRSWGALRVMSPDGYPIYDRSTYCSGASLVTCHSGVTLAAVHALVIAEWIDSELTSDAPDYLEKFSAKRFESNTAT